MDLVFDGDELLFLINLYQYGYLNVNVLFAILRNIEISVSDNVWRLM